MVFHPTSSIVADSVTSRRGEDLSLLRTGNQSQEELTVSQYAEPGYRSTPTTPQTPPNAPQLHRPHDRFKVMEIDQYQVAVAIDADQEETVESVSVRPASSLRSAPTRKMIDARQLTSADRRARPNVSSPGRRQETDARGASSSTNKPAGWATKKLSLSS